MKNLKKSFVYFITLSTVFVGCSKDDIVYDNLNQLNNEDVIETFTSDLPENVSKIQTVSLKHPLLNKSSLISKKLKTKSTAQNTYSLENVIYYFTNNSLAALSYDGEKVYATVFNKFGMEIDNLIADFSNVDTKNIVTINYLDRNEIQTVNINSSFTNKSWGSCMDEAIDLLYDDWNDDPVGTFSCWVTGPLCAIGGGIACGIKQL